MDPQEELKNLSVAFVLALTQAGLSDNEVAWQGVMALFAASRIPGTIADTSELVVAVKRLQKMGAATP